MLRTAFYFTRSATTGFTVSAFLYPSRVSLKEAFAVLELCARKLACTVLRGPDPSNGVWLLGANPDNRLRPEMLASAEIPVGERKRILLVPSEAIQQIDGQDIVFVRTAADRFTVRPVRTGETAGGQTPILDGLQPGEQVVVRGSFVLKSHLLKSTMESE